MRADRLVAIVLLLQVHGRLTVPEIAERLETSERTIRRDLDALCMAGVPVYSQRGRGGGWALLGGHRIDLSGLTADEAQALLVATDSAASSLGPGFTDGLAAARRKLVAALPTGLRELADAATASVVVDRSRWGPTQAATSGRADAADGAEHLGTLRRALVRKRQVCVLYEPPGRPAEERRLHPHGLVRKREVWYLVATAPAGLRTYRLSRIRSVTVTDEPATVPEGFELTKAWAEMQEEFGRRAQAPLTVVADVRRDALRRVRARIGAWWPVEPVEPVEETGAGIDGTVRVEMRFAAVRVAAVELCSPVALGDVAVVSPDEVRRELHAMGRALVERYAPHEPR